MNKRNVNTAIKVFKDVATQLGIEQQDIRANDSPWVKGDVSIYIDGDLVDEYWGHGYTGWNFQNKVVEELGKVGLWVEPYNTTIFDVYTK